jgi:hypothetical protein
MPLVFDLGKADLHNFLPGPQDSVSASSAGTFFCPDPDHIAFWSYSIIENSSA